MLKLYRAAVGWNRLSLVWTPGTDLEPTNDLIVELTDTSVTSKL